MRTAGNIYWARQLRLAKEIWGRLRPEDSQSSGSSGDRQYGFGSVREITQGINFGASVQGWQIDETRWSIRVRGRLHDYRVTALRSFAENLDMSSVQFLDFDILAAHHLIEGQPLVASPDLDFHAPDEIVFGVMEMYSVMVDRIWDFFGGFSRANFEALALWMMRQQDTVGSHANSYGGAFAAFLYGDMSRAKQFLADLEAHWEQRARDGADRPVVHQVRSETLKKIALARRIIDGPTPDLPQIQ